MNKECSTGWIDLPDGSPLFGFLTELGRLNNEFLGYFVFIVGPINVLVNCLVMFILTRKELRSTYNIVFFVMALDQTIVMGGLVATVFKTIFTVECNPQSFPLFWVYYDIVYSSIILIFRAHSTWLAVIIALMRLMSIRSNGASELHVNRALQLCAATLLFVTLANTPNFFTNTVDWVPLHYVCDADENGDVLIPITAESPNVMENDCLMLRLSCFLTGTLHNALPCILLMILTITLLAFLRKVRRERAHLVNNKSQRISGESDNMTTLLILVMVCTGITEIPIAFLSLLEGFLTAKSRADMFSKLNSLIISMMLITSSCNLFIYLFMSRKFREVCMRYMCCPCRALYKITPLRPRKTVSK